MQDRRDQFGRSGPKTVPHSEHMSWAPETVPGGRNREGDEHGLDRRGRDAARGGRYRRHLHHLGADVKVIITPPCIFCAENP